MPLVALQPVGAGVRLFGWARSPSPTTQHNTEQNLTNHVNDQLSAVRDDRNETLLRVMGDEVLHLDVLIVNLGLACGLLVVGVEVVGMRMAGVWTTVEAPCDIEIHFDYPRTEHSPLRMVRPDERFEQA